MNGTLVQVALCGAIRPRDGVTLCNNDLGHKWEHARMGEWQPDGNSGARYRPHFATWSQEGIETCDHCGHRIDNATGMCTAPLSSAD